MYKISSACITFQVHDLSATQQNGLTQVFRLMEAHDPRAITVAALTSALLAEADVGHPQSFHHTLSQHRAVLDSMSAREAHQVFSAAVSQLRQQSDDDMVVLAKIAWQATASKDRGSKTGGQMAAEQLDQLVEVYLSRGQTQQALAVRVFAGVAWYKTGRKAAACCCNGRHQHHGQACICCAFL